MRRKLRGSMVTTMTLTLPATMGFVSMGVDWGQISVARQAARAAADEAALAAASALSDSPDTEEELEEAYALGWERATQYTEEMTLNNLEFTLDTLIFGYYDEETGWSASVPAGESPNAVQANVSSSVHMTFAKLLGVSSVTVHKSAKAGASIVPGRAPDLVIVQDVTPSMSSTDIANSKLANAALVECIEDNADPATRGAYVKFANIDRTLVPLESYEDAPGELYDAAAGISPSNAYSSSGICTSGCTSHSSGLYAAVDILNSASEPPEDVGQAIIIITDGAPATSNSGCSATASSSGSATDFQKWLVGDSSNRCGKLSAQTTQTNCNNVGGRWLSSSYSPRCRPSDNGAETSTGAQGPGTCSLGTSSSYNSEFKCEGAGGTWRRTSGTTPNPSSLTQWTDEAKALAESGTWGPIDVYAVYYSSGASTSYKNNALAFLNKHVVSGAGAELGVLDAPTGTALVDALQDLCKKYTVGRPGLIE
jgi:Flp pilus assembly protein TadG